MKKVTVSCKVYYDFSLEVPDDELDDIESYCDSNDPVYQRLCKAFNFEGIDFEECSDKERSFFINRGFVTKIINKAIPSTKKIFEETKMYHPEIYSFKDKYLEGYFLCNKYYDDILPFLANEIVFPKHSDPEMQKRNEELIEQMDGWHTASIHLRRGDYVTQPENEALFGGIATDAYRLLLTVKAVF